MKRHRDSLSNSRPKKSHGSALLDCDDDTGLQSSEKRLFSRPRKALLRRPSPVNQRIQTKSDDYGHGSRQTFLLRRSPSSKFQNNGRSANIISHNEAKKLHTSTSNIRPFRSYNNTTNRVDPVFAAAAAAAAMNAGLSAPSSDPNIGLASGAAGNSSAATVAAVAAAAMNAAAMAAALGAGGLFNSRQLETINKALNIPVSTISGSNANARQHLTSNKSNRTLIASKQLSSGTRNARTDHITKERDRDHNNFNPRFPHHLDHRDPENDPSATRTLFVGNLAPDINEEQLRELFERYGFIEDIDIKRRDPETGANAYAFVRFVNLDMAHRAKVDMSGQMIGQFTCKIGYGKVVPTRCLWVGGLGPWITYPSFAALLDKLGPPEKIIWPSGKNYANILFPNVELAIVAANALRGYPLGGNDRRIRVDFTDEAHMVNNPLKRRKLGTGMYDQNKHYSSARDNNSTRQKRDSPVRSNTQFHTKRRRDPKRNDDYPREQSPASSDCSRNRSFSRSHKSRLASPSSRKMRDRTSDDTIIDSFPSHPASKSPEYIPKIHSSSRAVPVTVNTALNIEQLSSCLPAAWDGAFYLKSSSFPCRMHILRGDQSLVDQFMYRKIDGHRVPEECRTNVDVKNDESHHDRLVCLRITQRMKLDPLKLDDVNQRIEAAGNAGFCVLLAVPSSLNQSSLFTDNSDSQKQPQRPLRNLIAYLRTKDSAGVVLLNPLRQNGDTKTSDGLPITGVLHAFPPCDFAFGLIKERAASLQKDYTKDDHLVILLIRSTGAL